MTQKIHNTYGDVLMVLGASKAHFHYSLNLTASHTKAPPRHVAYALQKLFKEELKWLQEPDIITCLGVDEMAQWCKSLVVVPKVNSKVRLCLDPVQLNQALIRLIHRGQHLTIHYPNSIMYNICPSLMPAWDTTISN